MFCLELCLFLRCPPPAFLNLTWPLRVMVTRLATPLCGLDPCIARPQKREKRDKNGTFRAAKARRGSEKGQISSKGKRRVLGVLCRIKQKRGRFCKNWQETQEFARTRAGLVQFDGELRGYEGKSCSLNDDFWSGIDTGGGLRFASCLNVRGRAEAGMKMFLFVGNVFAFGFLGATLPRFHLAPPSS